MSKFKFIIVFFLCFFSNLFVECTDVVLINLCGQEVKVLHKNSQKSVLDGQGLIFKHVAFEKGEKILVAPVSRFHFNEEMQYGVIDLKNKKLIARVDDNYIILIDGFSEEDPDVVKYRIKKCAQGEKSFRAILNCIVNINGKIKPGVEHIYEKIRKGIVAIKQEGKVKGVRLRGMSRKNLISWKKELQKNKEDIASCAKEIATFFDMSNLQQNDLSNSFYFDLSNNIDILAETIRRAEAKLL